MSKFTPERLTVEFRQGVTPVVPIIPRRYTLTHSDTTAELFLTIGLSYAYDKVSSMRDEVLGQWVIINNQYFFSVYLYISGPSDSAAKAAIRNGIFTRELPLALEAIRYGDDHFFTMHPQLDYAPILVHYMSAIPMFNRIETFGTFSNYVTSIAK